MFLRTLVIFAACAVTFTNARSYPLTTFVEALIHTKVKVDQHPRYKIPALMANNIDDDKNNQQKNVNENESVESQINTLLDTPLFDPDSEANEDNWFANLVKNDYDAAEALYVGIIGVVGVIVSQEMLRIVKYGADNYVPFGRGGGNLF